MRSISLLRAVGKCSFHISRDFSLPQETITENHSPSKYREHVIMGYPDSADAHTTQLLNLRGSKGRVGVRKGKGKIM